MCNATNHKSHGSGLPSVNEVHKHIVYILDIYFGKMVIQCTAARGSLMQTPNTKAVSGNVLPMLLTHIVHPCTCTP